MAGIVDPRDAAPLVASRRGTSPSSSNDISSFLHQHRKWIAIAVFAVACATSLHLYKRDSSIQLGGDVECRKRSSTPAASDDGANADDDEEGSDEAKEADPCPAICSAHRQSYLATKWSDDTRTAHSSFDPLSIDHLIDAADQAHRQTILSLKRDYGNEYYNKLFVNDDPAFGNGSGGKSIGRYGFWGAGRATKIANIRDDDEEGQKEKKKLEHGEMDDVSRKRYVRKMMMKVLKMQLSVADDLSDVGEDQCDCTSVPDMEAAEADEELRKRRKTEDTAESDLTGKLRRRTAEDGDEATTNGDGEGEGAAPSNSTATEENEDEPQQEEDAPSKHYYDTIVVANGGHSSAAGHGNLFDESYTAILQKTASAVYSAVGLNLLGRNHAMGGMPSGSELALCAEAVYGIDADVITWNYGMTDGNQIYKRKIYSHRRGAHRNRPLLLEISTGLGNEHLRILEELESSGLGTVVCRLDVLMNKGGMKELFPDMAAMTSEEEMNKVPRFVRHFRCGNDIESGDPTCGDDRYNDTFCPVRKFKAPWHPGWKEHAHRGNVLALFMIEVLVDALNELRILLNDNKLAAGTTQDAAGKRLHLERILSQLQAEEDQDYLKFHQSHVPTMEHNTDFWNDDVVKSLPLRTIFRDKAVCHTAIMPAMTRYQGIFNNDPQPDRLGIDNFLKPFEMGLNRTMADAREASPNGPMQLAYDDNSRQVCEVPLTIDFKDYFLVRQVDGESFVAVPNEAEEDAYLDGDRSQLKGVVVVCFVRCDWGQCPPGMLNWDQLADGNMTMAVNRVPVTGYHRMGRQDECAALRRDIDNHQWEIGREYYFPPNGDGRFEVMAKANQEDSYLRITSVIVL